jgi:phage terminase large subunit
MPTDLPPLETSPTYFASVTLGMELYEWQARVMEWFNPTSQRTKGALCTPNGAGKSERVVASMALWWLALHRRGKVVITTKDSKQLDNQVQPAIEKHRGRFEKWKFIDREIKTPTGGLCVMFTTDEAGRAEGWHKEDDLDGPLLMIVDEAKSVQTDIFQAIDRCTFNALLYVSSPGVKNGRFYDTFTNPMGFKTLQVGLKDCPHIPKERIDDIIATYGSDHPFTLSTLHGEFMEEDGDTMFVIPPSVVREAYESPPVFVDGRQYAFCDFAAGGDENVLAHRVGNRIMPLLAWKDTNTMASVGRLIVEFQKRGLKPSDIYGDEGGLGGPMIDRLAEAGWPINRVNNGASAHDNERYENRGAEMWHQAGLLMAQFGIILPQDDKLRAQLTTRKIKMLSDGRLGVESKKDMHKRGLGSPDRADSVCGICAIESEVAAGEFDQDGIRALEKLERQMFTGILSAADFGPNWKDQGDGWIHLWEKPEYGRAYLVNVKAGRDGWSVFVLRKSFTDERNKFQNTAAVCRIKAGCDWDAGLLADRIDLLARWYGNPTIVPDLRNGMDILERLKEKGCSILRRPVFDRQASGDQFTYGWETNERNYGLLVSTLARAVRERSFDVWCPDAVRDMRRFARRDLDNGDSLCLAIGLQSMDAACVMMAPRFKPAGWGNETAKAGMGACS